MLEHERDQVFFRRRVEKQRALRDARALGHGGGGRGLEAPLHEEPLGRLADARSLVLFVGFTAHVYDSGHL